MNYKEEYHKIDEEILDLQNKKYLIEKLFQIEDYKERINLVGKCFQNNDEYYKIIDLDLSNQYRCFALTFITKEIDISKMESQPLNFCNPSIIKDINDLGPTFPHLKGIMIKDIKNMNLIDSEFFEQKYLEQCRKMLNIDDFLKTDRIIKLEKEKEHLENKYKKYYFSI